MSEQVQTSKTVCFIVKHHPSDLNIGCLLGDRVDEIRKLNGFVAITRIFEGLLEIGSQLYVLTETGEESNVSVPPIVIVKRMYMLMGSSLIPVTRAIAGTVVGIELEFSNSDDFSGGVTLASDPSTRPLISPYQSASAIVRVTVEVKKSAHEEILDEGLKLLAKSDPAVIVSRHPQTGERIVGCCGDEHLARCIQDLENLFAPGISLSISAPIVEIRESIAAEWLQPGDNEEDDVGDFITALPAWLSSEFSDIVNVQDRNRTATCIAPDGTAEITIRACPIPTRAMEWIEQWKVSLRSLFHERHVPTHIWPHYKGNKTVDGCIASVVEILESMGVVGLVDMHVKNEAINILSSEITSVIDCIKFGFQQACMSGPLSEEPVRGVLWTIVGELRASVDHSSSSSVATIRACRASLLASPVRIAEPMLSLELQTEEIRAAQTVLATRRANIFHSDLVEGSYSEYMIKAFLPASDAFRLGEKSKLTFSDELRGATHGKVVWRLSFSHWAVLDNSCPLTTGVAHRLICGVRKRKGLSIGEKVVVDSDKQRTLTKMK
jgi:translation elongation factor EF-G